MAGRDMKVSVLVQLVDRLTAPLRGITGMLGGLGSRLGDIGRRIGIVGGALAGLSFMAPIQQAAAYDSLLRDIAITAGKTGGAVEQMIGDIGKRYEKLAIETGQRSMDIGKGAQTLIASNMDPTLIEKLMPTIARVATATGATLEDTAKTAFSLSDALKVPADQMEAMLGKLVVAGKLGRFEFKNMATEFPGLTAQMQKFGITGKEAVETLGASLQIAMLGTANPAKAATNLTNFLTKINAPEAIKKFEKELSVDVTGVMTDAAAKGINPIEAVLEKMTSKLAPQQAEIDKIMKKAGITDKERESQIKTLLAGTKVGKLYADMQVLGFVLPFLQNREKYLAFRKEIAASGVDVIAADFSSRMRGLSVSLAMFGEIGTQVMRRVGLAFASNLPMANEAMTQLLQWTARIDAAWPGLIDGVLSWTGALLALGAGIAILTPVFSALIGIAGAIGSAFLALLSPIGIVAALIAGAAVVIYRNWENFAPFFREMFEAVKQIAQGFVDFWTGLWSGDFSRAGEGISAVMSGISRLFSAGWSVVKDAVRLGIEEIGRLFGVDNLSGAIGDFGQRVAAGFSDAWEKVKSGEALQSVISWLGAKVPELATAVIAALPGMVEAGGKLLAGIGDGLTTGLITLAGFGIKIVAEIASALVANLNVITQAGAQLIGALTEGIQKKLNELLAWLGGIGDRIVAAIGSIDITSMIKWPTPPAWLSKLWGGGADQPGATNGVTNAPAPAVDPMGNPMGGSFTPSSATGGAIGGSNGFAQRTAQAANSNVQVGGQITVTATGDAKVTNVQSSNPAVPVTPNRGTMVGRA